MEYSLYSRTSKHLQPGQRAADVAAKHSRPLEAAGSPFSITALALQEWIRKGKEPGTAPRKPGRKADPKVEVLVQAIQSAGDRLARSFDKKNRSQ